MYIKRYGHTNTETNNFVHQIKIERHNCQKRGRKRLMKERIEEVIKQVKTNMKLAIDLEISTDVIKHRLKRGGGFLSHNERFGGCASPLADIKPFICQILIMLSKMRHSVLLIV